MPKITQVINIIDRTITSPGTGVLDERVFPTAGNYSGTVTWWFEVVAEVSSGTATIVLEETDGTDMASISFTETSQTRKRVEFSGSLTGNYDLQINVTAAGTGLVIDAARVIVIQSNELSITATETQIEIGERPTNLTGYGSSAPWYTGRIWYYDSTKWDGSITWYVEVVYDSASTKGSITVYLQEDTTTPWTFVDKGSAIVNAINLTTPQRTRVAFTPTSGKNYRLRCYTSGTKYAMNIFCAKIIAVQTGSPISKLETVQLIDNVATAQTTGLRDKDIAYYNGTDTTEWQGVTNVCYHEICTSITSTFVAKLQSDPNGTPADITNSSVTASNLRTRGGSALSIPDGAPTTIDTYIVTAGSSTQYFIASRLLIQTTIASVTPSSFVIWIDDGLAG